jgi:hypothetical protein
LEFVDRLTGLTELIRPLSLLFSLARREILPENRVKEACANREKKEEAQAFFNADPTAILNCEFDLYI